MRFDGVGLEGLVSLVSSVSSGSYVLSSLGFPDPREERFHGDIPFRA